MASYDLQLDVPIQVRGRFVANWEVAGLAVRLPWRVYPVLCRLEHPDGRVIDAFELAAIDRPDNWRHHHGVRLDVVAHVTPLERGRWGHRGLQRWRLRLDDVVAVSMRSRGPGS